jgi:hypothetical protein
MRTTAGVVPEATQDGIDKSLNAEGYFLPCLCRPMQDLNLDPRGSESICPGRSHRRQALGAGHPPGYPHALGATLITTPDSPFLLRRADGLCRAYALAGVPALEDNLDIHVK